MSECTDKIGSESLSYLVLLGVVYTQMKVHGVWNRVQIKYGKLSKKCGVVDFANNLGFSLCTAPTTCCLIAILKSKDRVWNNEY